jgi:hypothetical protein
VYWANLGDGAGTGSIMRVPLGGGTAVTLASAQDPSVGLAVDSSSLYWTDYAGGVGTIVRLTPK